MKGHFSVINKRGAIVACSIMAISILLFSVSVAQRVSSASILWTIPLVGALIIFILSLLILVSVITAGIDIRQNQVIFADATGQGGKKPQFMLKDLKAVELHDNSGKILDSETSSMVGARIVFILKNGETRTYYPVQLTNKQFLNIKSGLLQMAKESKTSSKKPLTKADKMAAKMQKEKEKKAVKSSNIKKL